MDISSPILALLLAASLAADTAQKEPGPGIDVQGLDRSVSPGDDFFEFSNGTWLKTAEIPPDRSTTGIGAVMSERTAREVAALIQEAADGGAKAGSEARKIGDAYASFMDEAGIEARGLSPLKPDLDRIAAIEDKTALARALGETLRADVDVFNATVLHTDNLFGLWVAADLDAPTRYSPFLLQGGIGMPDREYYVSTSKRMQEVQGKYREHVAALLGLAGVKDAGPAAERIYELERKIAATHWTRAKSEEVEKGNNHWPRGEFPKRAPGLDWEAFFAAAGLSKEEAFVVWQPEALVGESALVGSEPLSVWKEWLTFHTLNRASIYLPKAFVDERFSFYGRGLAGTQVLQERWKRAVTFTNAVLGEAVGKLYVKRYFPPEAKAAVQTMVKNLVTAFRQRIDRLDWMTPETKEKARAKLATIEVGVGYPDKWRDYSALSIVRGDALGNWKRALLFEYRRSLARLGQKVDRHEWVMTPQTVNAVNLPVLNALNFPAAELRPPHFDPKAPAAANYGSVGTIIGHEISHSFDSQGALFDAEGRLDNWWTKDDFAHFQASAAQLVRQYDGYRPFEDLAVKGDQTLAENIADVAGVAAAFDGYHLSLRGAKPAPVDGLSGDAQFFIAYAQSWRQKIREPALRQLIVTDGHAPARYRALTVRNLDPWYDTFAVKPGEKLYLPPPERVRVW